MTNVTRRAIYRPSLNQCCRGKVINITYSKCVFVRVCGLSYPACKAHAPFCMPSVAFLGLLFGKMLLNLKCVFDFPLQLSSDSFLILGGIQGDINIHKCSCQMPVIIVRF